jgi:hypothetical protein
VFADHVLRPMIAEGTPATLGGRDRSAARITFTVPDGIERHWLPQPFRARNVWIAGGHDPSGVFVVELDRPRPAALPAGPLAAEIAVPDTSQEALSTRRRGAVSP